MKTFIRSFALLALAALLAVSLCANALSEEAETVDFAGRIAFDTRSETVKQQVTVKNYVDGDTTHFFVPETVVSDGVFKARSIAVNTPESTGKIEEWGKAASRFTREKLENAEEIWVESDTAQWNLDSTSTRYLVWVWYRPQGEQDFRNLNIELLQNGLAIANSSAQNRYGETCMAAIAQARAQKRNIYSGEKDPDFFYGDAIELTIKELRLHPESYDGKKVAFTGVITVNHNNSVFIEDYDAETGLYFGFSAYYGSNMSGGGLEVLSVGNEARIVGTVQYYEAGNTWQVSGLTYRMMKPKDPGNIQIVSQGHAPSWKKTDPETFLSEVTIETESGPETYPYAFLALDTSVEMKNLTVCSQGEGEDKYSHWLSCNTGTPEEVDVCIPYDAEKTEQFYEALQNHTIDVRGIVLWYDHSYHGEIYCVRVFTPDGLTIHDDQ